jgi:bifunctional non-homologous end joining protein LigD
MGLAEYKRKRDFKTTPEPPGKGAAGRSGRRPPVFVVQEHHASTHHYDFRLEADGVLKSWAVPKGPSMSPADKRLAVEVEDHPLSYATFHGDIPEGHYGAGHVEVWDHGTYEAEPPASPGGVPGAIEKGRLSFTLHGRKLKGAFTLLRTRMRGGKPQWLLIKKKDRYAEEAQRRSAGGEPGKPRRKVVRSKGTARSASPSPSPTAAVPLSHPDKLLYPDVGLTKQGVADYYTKVADRMLPYLRNRPVTLERFPAGVAAGAPHFWQKNLPAQTPEWVPRVTILSETGRPVTYPLINDLNTLLYFVNQNAVTFHIYLSRVDALERPDFLLFDLDPGDVSVRDLVTVARSLHELLDGRGVPNYLKTSGKSGLHVLTPPPEIGATYEAARAWAERVAEELTRRHPDLATTERALSKRGGRIYVDYMQNALGHHVVAPYSLRPTPTATVSTPLAWKELTRVNPMRFTAKTLPQRLSKRGDPMEELLRPSGA